MNEPLFRDVGFTAGDFTGTAGDWTVAEADLLLFQFAVLNNMLAVIIAIATSTTAVACTALNILIPGGFTSFGLFRAPVVLSLDNLTTFETGYAHVNADGTSIIIERSDLAAFGALTDVLHVSGSLLFPVYPSA